MYAYQTINITSLPLFILYGANTNILFSEEIKGEFGTDSKKMALMLNILKQGKVHKQMDLVCGQCRQERMKKEMPNTFF